MLGSYIFFFFSLTNNQASINCFLQTCMALNLFLYTVDTTPGLYTEAKPHGFPPPKWECVQPIDEYIQTLAREALSPIQLPNSKLYFKIRSVIQKLMQWSTAECLYSCLGGIVPWPRSYSQHEILDFSSPDVPACVLCSNDVLFST